MCRLLGRTLWVLLLASSAAAQGPAHGDALWTSDGTPNGGPGSSDPGRFTAAGNKAYFEAATAEDGDELFSMLRSVLQEDPSNPPPPLPPAEGPASLVEDLTLEGAPRPTEPYPNAFSPKLLISGLRALGDRLYLWGNVEGAQVVDPAGYELWTSDGTVAGTHLLFDVLPGRRSSWAYGRGVTAPVALGGSVYFGACDDLPRCTLWRSDGLDSVEPVTVLESETPGLRPRIENLLAGEHRLYFTFRERPFSSSLWTSDGTPAGTRRLATSSSTFFVFPDTLQTGDRLTMVFDSGLWTSDGSPEGTHELLHQGFSQVVSSGDLVFLKTTDFDKKTHVWVSDGTPDGTHVVPEDTLEVEKLVPAGDGRCFVLSPTPAHSLWITDGTAEGTHLVATERFDSIEPVVAGGKLYFAVREGETLARVDADGGGYVELFGGSPIYQLVPSREVLYVLSRPPKKPLLVRRFAVDDPNPSPQTIGGGDAWDFGTHLGFRGGLVQYTLHSTLTLLEPGALEPKTFQPNAPASTSPRDLTPTGRGDDLLFTPAFDLLSFAVRIYRVRDGVADLLWDQDPDFLRPATSFARAAGRIFLLSPDLEEIDLVDGTLTPLGPSGASEVFAHPNSGAEFHGQLYFLSGYYQKEEIWKVEGHELIPVYALPGNGILSRDVDFGSPNACPKAWVVGEHLVLSAYGRLWSSLGGPLAQRLGDEAFRNCLTPTVHGEEIFYVGRTQENTESVVKLYRSDGTRDGTFALKELSRARSESEWSVVEETAFLGQHLFFVADDEEHGRELWTSDGTALGTKLFADVRPGPRSSFPRGLTVMGNRLYFAADDGAAGHELWTSDGTPEGTVLLRDIATGPESSYPQSLTAIDGRLLFAAMGSREQGLELWISDGTILGSYPLQEIQPGPFSSDPTGFVAAGDTIYFEAATRETGFELWSMPRGVLQEEPTPPPPPPPEPSCPDATACLVDGRFEVTVEWRNPRDGTSGAGRPISFSDESVLFWFFSDGNVELIVKILDGHRINGRYWVFYGGLSDVEFWITVTDSQTGAVREYHNPPGQICGNSDTTAFE